MRIVKEYDERKNEILDAAEMLFQAKGYEKCTVNDIINEVGIAKGTFYHYFRSKEEVIDAVVLRNKEMMVSRAEEILERVDIGPEEKLMCAFLSMQIKDKAEDDMLNELHKSENALLHQKTLNQTISAMAPILVKVIEEGTNMRGWSCKYPLQYMQIFLAASLSLTDEGIFGLDEDSQRMVIEALIAMLEKMLNVPENTFLRMFNQSGQ